MEWKPILNFLFYLFTIAFGILLSFLPNEEPVLAMGRRLGHIFTYSGIVMIFSAVIILIRKKNSVYDLDALHLKRSWVMFKAPKKIIRSENSITFKIDANYYYFAIFLVFSMVGWLTYLLLPRIMNFVESTMFESPFLFVLTLILIYLVAIIILPFYAHAFWVNENLIFDFEDRRIILKRKYLIQDAKNWKNPQVLTVPIENLSSSEITTGNVYELLVSAAGVGGDDFIIQKLVKEEKIVFLRNTDIEFVEELRKILLLLL